MSSMMSFAQNHHLRPLDPDDPAKAGADLPGSAGNAESGLCDDLLRHLPMDRESSLASNPCVVAAHRVTGITLDQLHQLQNSLSADNQSIFLTIFAILLARLTGQEVVRVRRISGDPVLLTLVFAAEASFRSILKVAVSESRAPDQPAAVEFTFNAAELCITDLPPYCLRLAVHVTESECELRLVSSTGLWSRPILQLWLRYFDHLLASAAAEPDAPWKTLLLIDESEAETLYRGLNRTVEAFENVCVHEWVQRQVDRTPNAIAVVSESQSLSYRELHQRSSAIARRLQALGAGVNRPVAVCLERGVALPVALLAVLKAGSCYVPLDPHDTRPRLEAILNECRPAAIIADQSTANLPLIATIPVIRPDQAAGSSLDLEDKAPYVTPDHPAYIIYTSGTTGKPKGVTIRHRALFNLIRSMMRAPGFTSEDRMLAVAPISFDIATMDMFLPLASGGTLVVADRFAAADPSRLAALLNQFEITVLQATPATWRLLASSDWEGKRDLKMISGGEALPRDLANYLVPHGKELWNCYGPTETTIYSSVLRMRQEEGVVPLGPPIANTCFYILDDNGRLLPPGVPGELYIGGVGVSAGYVRPPAGGAERFLPDPYAPAPASRMFRSGDLVRLINGNEFEFFGRLDQQVKLRGYRIELGEIEFALRSFPETENAVAALCEDRPGEPYLIAFVTTVDNQMDLQRLRDHIARLLPMYMLPSRYVLMETIPLTGSGKIDRKALIASTPSALKAYHQAKGVEPRTKLEEKLLTIFRDVLETPEFGVTDSFFDYGGYSLLAVKLFGRINRAWNLSLPISLLFDAPTVQSLAKAMDRSRSLPPIVAIRSQGQSIPLFIIHSYLLYDVLPQIVEPDRPVYGVRESPEIPQSETVENRAAIYVKEILKVCPKGPLLLTGWCAAGSLTVEIARQFEQLNHSVGLVALLDAERPGYRPFLRGKRGALLRSRVKFHLGRVRGSSKPQKLQYFGNFLRHLWDTFLESLFLRHRPWVLRLERIFGAAVPRVVFDNAWSRMGALQNYAPVNYPGKVLLFRAAEDPGLPDGDETMGWNEIVDGGVEVIFVPGDHESMFRKPNVHFLSQRFRRALRLAESA